MCSVFVIQRTYTNVTETTVMAKSKSKLSLADVPADKTLVRSRAYGDHIRAKRGTYKKARLNPALKKATILIVEANAAAKLFKDAIDPYREGIVDKLLWQNLVSMLRKQQTVTGQTDMGQLKPFELHSRYTLHRLYPVQHDTSFDRKTRKLRSVIWSTGLPRFDKSGIDSYKLTAIAVFLDLKKKTAKAVINESSVLPLKGKPAPFDVMISVPPGAKSFILSLRIDGWSKGKAYHTIASRGMAVIVAGSLAPGSRG